MSTSIGSVRLEYRKLAKYYQGVHDSLDDDDCDDVPGLKKALWLLAGCYHIMSTGNLFSPLYESINDIAKELERFVNSACDAKTVLEFGGVHFERS